MKTSINLLISILLILAIPLFARAQDKIIFKLNDYQDQRISISQKESKINVNFNNSRLNTLFQGIEITKFRKAFPLAEKFDHPASERVSKYWLLEGVFNTTDILNSMKDIPEVEYVFVDELPRSTHVPNDFGLAIFQNGLELINPFEAWDISKGNSQVKIAIIDDGFDIDHEDLVNQIVFEDNVNYTSYGHGTRVSGVAAAQTNNNTGIASIGYNSKLMLYYFSNPYNKMMAASLAGAKAINNSYISCSYVQANQDIINMVTDNGTLVIASAGNGTAGASCGIDGYAYPASYDNVISVSGTNWFLLYENGSSGRFTFNDKVDLTAPGWSIATTINGNDYATPSGTSFASPFVAGTAALVLDTKPCLSPQEVAYIIKYTTDESINDPSQYPENEPYIDISGTGFLDAYGAVSAAVNYPQIVTENASVQGPSLICTSGTFTLEDAPETATWSVTPSYLVTPSSGTGTTAYVTKVSNGNPTITFTIGTVGCSTVQKSFEFHTGPYSSSDYPIQGPSSASCNQYVYYSIPQLEGVTSINWTWPGGWTYVSGQGTRYLALRTGTYGGVVAVGVNNTCGQSGSYDTHYTSVYGCYGPFGYTIFPNPATSELVIELTDLKTGELVSYNEFNIDQILIINNKQEIVFKKQFKGLDNRRVTVDLRNIKAGTVYAKVKVGDYEFTERVIIKK